MKIIMKIIIFLICFCSFTSCNRKQCECTYEVYQHGKEITTVSIKKSCGHCDIAGVMNDNVFCKLIKKIELKK